MLLLLQLVTTVTGHQALWGADEAPTTDSAVDTVVDAEQFRAVCQRLRQATVRIVSSGDRASGVLISRSGLVLTVAHAIPENAVARRFTIPVQFANQATVDAVVLGLDSRLDLALLQLSLPHGKAVPSSVEPMSFADGLTLGSETGASSASPAWTVACGFPGRERELLSPPVRLGQIVFSDSQTLRSTCQLTVGDSGGPLISVQGKLLGINRRIGLGIDNNHHIPLAHVLAFLKIQSERNDINLPQVQREILQLLPPDPPAPQSDHHSRPEATLVPVIRIPKATRLAFRNYCVRIELPDQPNDAVDSHAAAAPSAGRRAWKQVALGTKVGQDTIATKLSLLQGAMTCRCTTFNGNQLDAVVISQFVEQDLAILKTQNGMDTGPAPADQRSPEAGKATTALPVQSCELVVTQAVSGEMRPGIISRVSHVEPRVNGRLGVSVSLRAGSDDAHLVIDEVSPNTTAAIASVKQGDRLLTCCEQQVTTIDQLSEVLSHVQPGDWIPLTVLRDAQELQLSGMLTPDPARMFARDEFLDGRSGPLSDRRNGFASVLQHDIPMLPADCGSPLVDFEGRLVGINIARRGREATLALPIQAILTLIAKHSDNPQ